MDPSSLERRKSSRLNLAIAVEVRDERGFSLHSSRDLSVGGAFFDRAIPHPVGARVQVSFTLPGDDRPLECAAEVVNVPDSTRFGMGVRFLDLRPDDAERLRAFLDELSGGGKR